MKRLAIALLVTLAAATGLSAQTSKKAETPSAPAVVVCNDGKRFSLQSFDISGLTVQEITRINQNNAINRCGVYDGVLKILAAEATAAAVAEPAAPSATAPPATTPVSPVAPLVAAPAKEAPKATACAENGSCSGDISKTTGAPKTVYVSGYTRKDGTYVRGHYRSK